MRRVVKPGSVGGSLAAPPSKSAAQRAVACAALANGVSELTLGECGADALAALRIAGALGAEISEGEGFVKIRGNGGDWARALAAAGRSGDAGLPEALAAPGSSGDPGQPRIRVSAGESGLSFRMFSAIAALAPYAIGLEAEGSLRRRPMDMVEGALRAAGLPCRSDGGFPPLVVRGPLRGGRYLVDGRESSQFVTGLLIALAAAEGDSEIEIEGLASAGYVDITLDVMARFGAKAVRLAGGGRARYAVKGRSGYRPARYEVEGDWSGAAFLLVAGAISGDGGAGGARGSEGAGPSGVEVRGLSLNSAQPDRAVLAALGAAGAELSTEGGRVAVRRSRLRGFEFDARGCPDLFPPLVALASACSGESRIRGASRLRAKESDRAAALSEEFSALGLSLAVEGDEIVVRPAASDALRGGIANARGDHRIAMAAAVAALGSLGPVAVDGAECVAKSYPGFWRDLAALGADVG
jgi:3-phosphoshikimate 1-carboxyvinyltransferase